MCQSVKKQFLKTLASTTVAATALLTSLEAQIRYELVVPEIQGNPINRVSSQSNEINENGETLLNRINSFAVWKNGRAY